MTPLHRLAIQFLRFAMVGGIATAIHFLILITLVRGADMNAVWASALGFTFSAICNYYLNYRFTFRSNTAHRHAVMKFVAVACVGLALNSLTMLIATEYLGTHYLLAQVIATGLVLLWSFSGNRWWTFNRP
ncbi:MAG: GtrA family protein [Gammaproteobacteria bacterium]|nr:GtrA family protein [Gammaproteobacteria bacterium]